MADVLNGSIRHGLQATSAQALKAVASKFAADDHDWRHLFKLRSARRQTAMTGARSRFEAIKKRVVLVRIVRPKISSSMGSYARAVRQVQATLISAWH